MTNNRYKKIRKITVNDIVYHWLVSDFNCDGDGSCKFRIYFNRKVIFDGLTTEIITPKRVKDIIVQLQNSFEGSKYHRIMANKQKL